MACHEEMVECRVPQDLELESPTKKESTSTPSTTPTPNLAHIETKPHNNTDTQKETQTLISTTTTSPQSSSPKPTLLTLPLELRLLILSHLLILPSTAPPPSENAFPHNPQPPSLSLLHPSILRCSQQLHAEGLPLLYTQNTYLAHPTLLLSLPRLRRAYSPVLTQRLADLITRVHVCVRLDAEPGYDKAIATAQLSGKEEVVLEAWQAMWRGSGPDVLRLFEGVRGVRRARVEGSIGGFEEYARWLEKAMVREPGAKVDPFCWDAGREVETGWWRAD
ncbi:hypothetical protein F4806DRAFT_494620 [Annulohypoxylon nitens]|nr:hypothetical protein F4806DRAFT_494620 [Annulohypoxylon nitens]